MMLIKEAILHLMASVCVIVSSDNFLDSMHVEYYKLVNSNCSLKDVNITKTPASVIMCASLCMHKSTCTGFMERHEECSFLESCPPRCRPLTEAEEIWNVYRPGGKYKILGKK